ncbi:MAG: peptide chain release factor 1 [Planctomycetota bacterium]|jgi:peptide chain release factor 1
MKPEEEQNLVSVVEGMIARFREIETAIQDPKIATDASRYPALMREYRRLARIVEPALEWTKLRSRLSEAQTILAEPDADEELKEVATVEIEEVRGDVEAMSDQIRDLLLTQDEFADRSVVVEIRAGTGGEEAALFSADLYRMFQRYAEAKGWRFDLLSSSPTDLGGFKEVVFSVDGEGVFSKLQFESGGHRVQRVPETETGGRIHTSACTVAVLPEPEEVEVDLKTEDLKIDTFRASGPGGQKVNKTSSAVRMTHLPTSIVVSCQDEKSQHKNRAKALKIMRTRLFELEQQKKSDERSARRRSQIGSGDRSQRVRTYNFPQNRVTDHRIKANFSLQGIMAGDLDNLLEALGKADRVLRLSEMEKSNS